MQHKRGRFFIGAIAIMALTTSIVFFSSKQAQAATNGTYTITLSGPSAISGNNHNNCSYKQYSGQNFYNVGCSDSNFNIAQKGTYTISYSVSNQSDNGLVIYVPLPSYDTNTIHNLTPAYMQHLERNLDAGVIYQSITAGGQYTPTAVTIQGVNIPAHSIYRDMGVVTVGTTSQVSFKSYAAQGIENGAEYEYIAHIAGTAAPSLQSESLYTQIQTAPNLITIPNRVTGSVQNLTNVVMTTSGHTLLVYTGSNTSVGYTFAYNNGVSISNIYGVNYGFGYTGFPSEDLFNPILTIDMQGVIDGLIASCGLADIDSARSRISFQDPAYLISTGAYTATYNLARYSTGNIYLMNRSSSPTQQHNNRPYPTWNINYTDCPDGSSYDIGLTVTADNTDPINDTVTVTMRYEEPTYNRGLTKDGPGNNLYPRYIPYTLTVYNGLTGAIGDIVIVDKIPADMELNAAPTSSSATGVAIYYSTAGAGLAANSTGPAFDRNDPLGNGLWSTTFDPSAVWIAATVDCLDSSINPAGPAHSSCHTAPTNVIISMDLSYIPGFCVGIYEDNLAHAIVHSSYNTDNTALIAITPDQKSDSHTNYIVPLEARFELSSYQNPPININNSQTYTININAREGRSHTDILNPVITIQFPSIDVNGVSTPLPVDTGFVFDGVLASSINTIDRSDWGSGIVRIYLDDMLNTQPNNDVRFNKPLNIYIDIGPIPKGSIADSSYGISIQTNVERPDGCPDKGRVQKERTSTVQVNIQGNPTITFDKSVKQLFVISGGIIQYSMDISNIGLSAISNQYIIDIVPTDTLFTQAYTQISTGSINYQCSGCTVYFAQANPALPDPLNSALNNTLIQNYFSTGIEISPGIREAPFAAADVKYIAWLIDDNNLANPIFATDTSAKVGFAVQENNAGLGTNIVNQAGQFSDILLTSISNTATTQVVSQGTDLSIDKTATTALLGTDTQLVYTIQVINNGPDGALDVFVQEEIPTLFDSFTTSHPYTGTGFALGTLAIDDAITITITGIILGTTDRNSITNTAVVTTSSDDLYLNNNTDSVTTDRVVDLDIDIQVSPAIVLSNYTGDLIYTITYNNASIYNAINTDIVIDTTHLQSWTSSLTAIGNSISLGDLQPRASGTIIITGSMTPGADTAIIMTGSITSDSQETILINNTSVAQTTITPIADIMVLPYTQNTGYVNEPYTWTIPIQNDGPNTAANPQITFTLSGADINTLGGLSTQAYSCTDETLTNCNWLNINTNQQSGNMYSIGLSSMPEYGYITFGVNGSLPDLGDTMYLDVSITSPTQDPDLSNNTITYASPLATNIADIMVLPYTQNTGYVNEPYTWTIPIQNDGPNTAANPQITFTLSGADINTLGGLSTQAYSCTDETLTNCNWLNINTNQQSGNMYSIGLSSMPEYGYITFGVNGSLPDLGDTMYLDVSITSPTQDPDLSNNTITYASPLDIRYVDLSINKTISISTGYAGQWVSYVIDYANLSETTGYNVTISDNLDRPVGSLAYITQGNPPYTFPIGVSSIQSGHNIGELPPYTTGQIIFTVQLEPNPVIIETLVTNTAEITSAGSDSDLSNNTDTASITISDIPTTADLQITKTANLQTGYYGIPITYTITYTNLGPDTAVNVQIQDIITSDSNLTIQSLTGNYHDSNGIITTNTPIPNRQRNNTMTLPIVPMTVPSGESGEFTITLATKDDVGDTINNTVSITSMTPDLDTANNTDAVDVDLIRPFADVFIEKYAITQTGYRGETVTFGISYQNLGPNPAFGVSIQDQQDQTEGQGNLVSAEGYIHNNSGNKNTTIQNQGRYTNTIAGGISYNRDNMIIPVGETGLLLLTFDLGSFTGNNIINTGEIIYKNNDTNTGNNISVAQIPVIEPTGDLSIQKTADRTTGIGGSLITYTFTIVNNSDIPATNVYLEDIFSRDVEQEDLISANGSISFGSFDFPNNNTIVIQLQDLNPGMSGTFELSMMIPADITDDTFDNDVTIYSNLTDSDISNNTDSYSIAIGTLVADLSINKLVNSPIARLGDPLVYTLQINNLGPDMAEDVVIEDILGTGFILTGVVSGIKAYGTTGDACFQDFINNTGTYYQFIDQASMAINGVGILDAIGGDPSFTNDYGSSVGLYTYNVICPFGIGVADFGGCLATIGYDFSDPSCGEVQTITKNSPTAYGLSGNVCTNDLYNNTGVYAQTLNDRAVMASPGFLGFAVADFQELVDIMLEEEVIDGNMTPTEKDAAVANWGTFVLDVIAPQEGGLANRFTSIGIDITTVDPACSEATPIADLYNYTYYAIPGDSCYDDMYNTAQGPYYTYIDQLFIDEIGSPLYDELTGTGDIGGRTGTQDQAGQRFFELICDTMLQIDHRACLEFLPIALGQQAIDLAEEFPGCGYISPNPHFTIPTLSVGVPGMIWLYGYIDPLSNITGLENIANITSNSDDPDTNNNRSSVMTTIDNSNVSNNPPVVTLSGSNTITISQGTPFIDPGAWWTDTEDGTGSILIATSGSVNHNTLGSYTLTYQYIDTDSNPSNIVTRTVHVTDQTAPVVTLVGNETMTITQGGIYTEVGATWIDNVDGSGNIATATSGSINTAIIGTYILEYTYIDNAGNTGNIVTRTIHVTAQPSEGGGGGGGGGSSPDNCTCGDYSPGYYDGKCVAIGQSENEYETLYCNDEPEGPQSTSSGEDLAGTATESIFCKYNDGNFKNYVFTDVISSPYNASVQELLRHCLVHGYSNAGVSFGTYTPTKLGEAYKVFSRLALLDFNLNHPGKPWSYGYQLAGQKIDLWKGIDTNKDPESSITQTELYQIALNYLKHIGAIQKVPTISATKNSTIIRGSFAKFIEMLIKIQ